MLKRTNTTMRARIANAGMIVSSPPAHSVASALPCLLSTGKLQRPMAPRRAPSAVSSKASPSSGGSIGALQPTLVPISGMTDRPEAGCA
jgi:hypothetical protein